MNHKELHYSSLTEEEQKKIDKKRVIRSYIQVILGSIIYSIGVVWILRLGGFFTGGATGAAQLIVGLFEKFCSNEKLNSFMNNNLGTFVMLINVPLLMFGWRGVSKKFVILTIVSIVFQTVCMNLLSSLTVSPFISLFKNGEEVFNILTNKTGQSIVGGGLIETIENGTFKILRTPENLAAQTLFQSTMLPGTRLILAVFGGLICGLGAALCLKSGGSTGGMDIISNYLHLKKHASFTKYSGIVDVVVISLSALISVENVLFTLIRLAIYMKTIDMLYNIYKTNRLEIVTTKANELREILLKHFNHSMTLYHCIGGYTNEGKESVVIYASKYEISTYINIIKDIDPKAFITITKTQIERSNYVQKTIV